MTPASLGATGSSARDLLDQFTVTINNAAGQVTFRPK
jgi:hypothetical protein